MSDRIDMKKAIKLSLGLAALQLTALAAKARRRGDDPVAQEPGNLTLLGLGLLAIALGYRK
jgi:hypothetical protein